MDQRQGVCQLELATGVTLSYVSTGPASGTPVLLLHAWGESRRSFDRLLPLLPVTIHAMAMDQRSHGDAGKPKVGYRLEHFAGGIVTFMDAAGIATAVLVGSSSGGYVAQQVAMALTPFRGHLVREDVHHGRDEATARRIDRVCRPAEVAARNCVTCQSCRPVPSVPASDRLAVIVGLADSRF